MKISLTVKPNARHEKILTREDGSLELHVKAPPVEGRANEAVIKMLARHYRVPKSSVTLIAGAGGRRKIADIDV